MLLADRLKRKQMRTESLGSIDEPQHLPGRENAGTQHSRCRDALDHLLARSARTRKSSPSTS